MTGLHEMVGEHTAANYIDECVMRQTAEPDVLFRLIVKMTANDATDTLAELRGFARYLHTMMEARYGNQ